MNDESAQTPQMVPENLSPAEEALVRAKEAAGGPKVLAELLGGITPQAISQWRIVPAGRVLAVEKHSGVSRHELRPDIYPSSATEAA